MRKTGKTLSSWPWQPLSPEWLFRRWRQRPGPGPVPVTGGLHTPVGTVGGRLEP